MSDVNLGSFVTDESRRDAIHVAVAPVEAAEWLSPGQRVGLSADGRAMEKEPSVGIVDPYLRNPVGPGDRFWLCLYPGTVTALRHEWSHPAFDAAPEDGNASRAESEAWLRRYAVRMNPHDGPGEAYQRLLYGLKSGDLFAHGSDLHDLDDVEDKPELVFHAGVVLGRAVDLSEFSFSCSC